MADCCTADSKTVPAQDTSKSVNELHRKIDNMMNRPPSKQPVPVQDKKSPVLLQTIMFLIVVVAGLLIGNLVVSLNAKPAASLQTTTSPMFKTNICDGKKVKIPNFKCSKAVADQIEQAGADVTEGYVGGIDNSKTPPITVPYYKAGLCPVNVHWHLGAEHRSAGQFDEKGKGPVDAYARKDPPTKPTVPAAKTRRLKGTGPSDWHAEDEEHRRLASGGVRIGYQCHHYDTSKSMYTTAYPWKHCIDMKVGQTYEIHWPHSTVGACGTPYQYQTPFYDGVFCNYPAGGATTHDNVGVQSQVFTVVNDEKYYYPDLIKGMIVTGDFGKDIAYYTGSTTGTTRDNDVCSGYSPITWQVDRKCHLISASSFDKLCADMKSQVDDMSGDLYAHGAREVVPKNLAAKQEVPAPAPKV